MSSFFLLYYATFGITFADPASSFSYFLISVHHSLLWFIILILFLVYWLLYCIIRNFTWSKYSTTFFNNEFIFILNSYLNYYFYFFTVSLFKLFLSFFSYLSSVFIFLNSNDSYISFFYSWVKPFFLLIEAKLVSFLSSLNANSGLYNSSIYYSFDGFSEVSNFSNNIYLTLNLTKNSLDSSYLSNFFNVYFDLKADSQVINGDLFLSYAFDRKVSTQLFSFFNNAFFFNGLFDSSASYYFDKRNSLGNSLSYYLFTDSPASINNVMSQRMYDDFFSENLERWSSISNEFIASASFRHSSVFELIWGIFPTVILGFILTPSLFLLYSTDEALDPVFSYKVIGHQWYWSYEFSNWVVQEDEQTVLFQSYSFDSEMIETAKLDIGMKRLLETSRHLIVPIELPIKFLITSVMCYMHGLFLH